LRKIFVSVTNDLITDQRVFRTVDFLLEQNFKVTLIGRKLQSHDLKNQNNNLIIKRFHLLFNKGPLFYLCYNIRLFFYLIFHQKEYLLANDLDTLLANFLASKFSKAVLVYDSHELFTQVPELIHRPKTQKKWEKIESYILPKIKYAYTVCQPIADYYHEKYGTHFKVVRNLPYYQAQPHSNNLLSDFARGRKIILYQGALNIGRGLELLIDAIHLINHQVALIIIGTGDIDEQLKAQVQSLSLQDSVFFLGRIPFYQLVGYTPQANLGISLEQPGFGLSYEYSLPNKLFDYIQAEVPILGSNLSGIKSIIDTYQIGKTIDNFTPQNLSNTIISMIENPTEIKKWKDNLQNAKKELCWENEKQILANFFPSDTSI